MSEPHTTDTNIDDLVNADIPRLVIDQLMGRNTQWRNIINDNI
jgi:hypothetical protein